MLWSQINLEKYRSQLRLDDLKQMIQVYGRSSSRLFSLTGNCTHDNILILENNINDDEDDDNNNNNDHDSSKPIYFLDREFMCDILAVKCAHLNTIRLEHLDLSKLELRMFFEFDSLETLSLKWCYTNSATWYAHDENDTSSSVVSSNIKHLYLTRSSCSYKLNKRDMEFICKRMPRLTTLSITQTKSTLIDDFIEPIVYYTHNLESLDLVNTLLTDRAIELMCLSPTLSVKLKHLNVSMSSSLSNNCLVNISQNLTGLKSLVLTSCFGISDIYLLQNLVHLTYLNINNTSLDKVQISELRDRLAKCEIEFGHEKMLNKKAMWTINGSRNCGCSF